MVCGASVTTAVRVQRSEQVGVAAGLAAQRVIKRITIAPAKNRLSLGGPTAGPAHRRGEG